MVFRTMLINSNIGLKSWEEGPGFYIILFSTTEALTDFIYDTKDQVSFDISNRQPLVRNLL